MGFRPTAAASFYYRVKPKVKGGAKKLLKGKHPLAEAIKETEYPYIDLLPADFSTRNMDLLLEDKSSKQLKNLAEEYDYVFIDAPPGISLLSENIFNAADFILLPMIPSPLSVRSYEMVKTYFAEHELKMQKIIPFFTLIDARKTIHKQTIIAQQKDNKHILQTGIPYSSDMEKMGIHQAPVATFAPQGKAAMAYSNLWKEVKKK